MRPNIDRLIMAGKEGLCRQTASVVVNPVAAFDEFIVLNEVWCLLLLTDKMSLHFVDSLEDDFFSLIC